MMVIIIRNIFLPWIEKLKIGFEKVLQNPGPYTRENVTVNEKGSFFEDYCNWKRIEEFHEFIFNSPAAEIVGQLTNSESIQIFMNIYFQKIQAQIKKRLGIKISHIIV